ncbi:MAG: 50S ribosomal protein L32, partial [Oscillospiraceae bacterium]
TTQPRHTRRRAVGQLETPGIHTGPKCGTVTLPHRICKDCMTYNGREVAATEK